MNNIQLNIIANAQFQQVYAEVAKLKEAMLSLQKTSVGGPFTPANVSSIRQAQNAFDSAVLSTRAFNIEQVAMTSNIERFGKQLQAGKLSISNYYKIWRDSAKGTSAELDSLATSQARLNRSIAIADPLRPGYAKLVTDINGVVTAQEKQIFYQRALNTALQQGAIKLIDFGKNTQWMGRQLTVGLTMPLAMFGAGVSQAFLQVDKELTRMQKVYGTGLVQPTQAALKQIRGDVQALGTELAKTLGTSVQETASMAADLAATGLEGTKLLGATKEAIRLATLGELDHQQAMQATVSLQNVYKLSTQGLSEAVNFLNAVENQTSTSLQDLVDAIPRVGPIVQQLGGSFKDTAAMMVAMKEAGVPAAQGANAIKSALSSLINPSKNAQTAFKQFNIDLTSIAQKSGGAPIAMLKMLSDQMKNLDRLSQAQLIEKLFGKFQFARIQALIDNINKAGSQTATVFNLMGASSTELAGLAANELKQQTESASGRFKRMVESIKADLLPIGSMFLNSFTRIGNIVDKVINAFKTLAHVMGPAAKIFGFLGGTGLTGLIIAGPIIMLTGLFANLIGNILRGANAIRMFRQGVSQAGAGENKFLAGLHAMRNFYEDLDKSMIAARNQMELMPEAITSNAKAFDILNQSIRTLTMQFEALAAAQASSMGMPLTKGTGLAGEMLQMKLPGFAEGGWVPGSPSLGDRYPALLTGKEFVVPYPLSMQYGPFLNGILNGSIKKHQDGLEPVLSSFIPRGSEFVEGRGYKIQGVAGSSSRPAALGGGAEIVLQAKGELDALNQILANAVARIRQTRELSEKQIGDLTGKALGHTGLTTEFEDGKKNWYTDELTAISQAENNLFNFISDKDRPNVQEFWKHYADQAHQQIMDSLQGQFSTYEIEQAFQQAKSGVQPVTELETKVYQPILNAIDRDLETYAIRVADSISLEKGTITPGLANYLQVSKDVTNARVAGQISYPSNVMYGPYYGSTQYAKSIARKDNLNLTEARIQAAEQLKLLESEMTTQIEAASPARRFMRKVGLPISQGVAKGIEQGTPEVISAATKLTTAVSEQMSLFDDQAFIQGKSTVDKYALGMQEEIVAKTPGIKARLANMSFGMKSGIGMAAMMGGGYLGSALGGTAGSMISTATMVGSTVAMIPGIGTGLAVGLTALAAAVPLVTSAFRKMAEDARTQANALKASFQTSSQAVDYFHLKFTPMAQYDYSGVVSDIGKHVKSIQENKAAVDKLTSAYLNATDQMTKDYIKNVGKSKGPQLETEMKNKYATDIASGMSAQQAMQDISSIMNAAGISTLTQNAIRGKLDQKMTTSKAFDQSIKSASKQGTLSGVAKDDPYFAAYEAAAAKSGLTMGAQAVKAISDSLTNLGGVSTKTFSEIVKGMSATTKETINSKAVYEAFSKVVANGDSKVTKFTQDFQNQKGTTVQLSEAIRLLNAKLYTSDQILDMLKNKTFDQTFLNNIDKLLKLESVSSGNDYKGNGGGITTTPDYTKQFSPLLKQYEVIKKLIDSQTNAQKRYNDQLKMTQEYQTKQMDYFNQMKTAFTTGNYLQAATIQQSALQNQASYRQSLQEQKQSDIASAVDARIALIQEGQSSGLTLKQWLAKNKQFDTKMSNSDLLKMFTGLDTTKYSANTSNILAKANAVLSQGASMSSGGPFNNLTVVVNADNSVTPADFAQKVAGAVTSAIHTTTAKTQTSHKVTTKRRTTSNSGWHFYNYPSPSSMGGNK